MSGIRRLRVLATSAAAALGAVSITAVGAAPAQAISCTLPNVPGYSTVAQLQPFQLLTPPINLSSSSPLQASDQARVLDFTFCTPKLVENTTGFNVPKVPKAQARVILPQGYTPTKHYPVLYLLHGGTAAISPAQYGDWSGADLYTASLAGGQAFSKIKANTLANEGLIVVQPAGGNSGLYTDWNYATNHPESPKYESFHIQQLIPWVDANFSTWGDGAGGNGRAIAGLSMGGQGAMHYMQAYPNKFKAVASFSGAFLDGSDNGYGPFVRPALTQVYSNALGTEQSGDLGAVNGGTWLPGPIYKGSGAQWDYTNVLLASNIAKLAGKDVTITVGANDPTKPTTAAGHCQQAVTNVAENMNCVVNGELNKRIAASGVSMSYYSFQEWPGKKHDWDNWNQRLADWLPHAMSVLKKAA